MFSTTNKNAIITLAALAVPVVQAIQYDVVKDYSGPTFFDDWNFYDHFDNLTNGDANFVGPNNHGSLAYIDSNNHAIMKVDNTSTVAFNEKRNTVRIASRDAYAVNSMFVADMYHVPYGCSVWPAWWSQAATWPAGGEIDTFEGVNQVTSNQMALHTTQGCTQTNPIQSSQLVNSTDCNFQANSNEGCVVTNPSPASYGEAFANAGGGVFVTEFADAGVSVWFFSRNSVPDSLKNNASSIDSTTLGTPVANWPTGGCNVNQFFQPQHLIFDITLCGDFAGAANVFSQTCSGNCYKDYVVGDGSRYSTAYFEVGSVKVLSKSGTNTVQKGNGALSSLGAISRWETAILGLGVGVASMVL